MPVSGFFSSIADKAQNAISQTPLAGHIPGTSPTGDSSPSHTASQGGHRSLAFESLQHQIRNFGQQYTSTTPIQRIITLEKGVALDFDALARDGKTQSKELYTWGQDQDPDLTDGEEFCSMSPIYPERCPLPAYRSDGSTCISEFRAWFLVRVLGRQIGQC